MQRTLVSLICVIGIVGCGNNKDKAESNYFRNSINPQGGQDSGGGDTRGSSKQFVLDILKDKKRLAKDLEEILWNLKFFSGTEKPFVVEWKKNYDLSNIQIPEKIKSLKISKKCYDQEGQPKLAAITKFNSGGDICISYTQLMKIPAESLRKQLHALIFHEITHLMGHRKEDIPNRIQEIVLNNYDNLFINQNSNSHLEEIFIIEITNTKNFLQEIIDLPDSYFLSEQILADKKFINDYNEKSRSTFPVLIKSANSLLATIENRAEGNAHVNLENTKRALNQIVLLPYQMDELRNIVQHGGLKKYTPIYFKLEKDQNLLVLKREVKKALDLLEETQKNFEFLNQDHLNFWALRQ